VEAGTGVETGLAGDVGLFVAAADAVVDAWYGAVAALGCVGCSIATPVTGVPETTVCAHTTELVSASMQRVKLSERGCFTMQSEKNKKSNDDRFMRAAMLEEQTFPSASLYIVGLPIGNAADITLRAIWTLSHVDVIACEDTRETRKLLDRYAIATPTVAVHEHNERVAAQKLIERIARGERVALVTDAGTPAVSDPGAKVVQSVRAAGLRVIPVPGASAVISAMSAAGLDAYRFTFAGFVGPTLALREAALDELVARREAFVLYEAPHRIRELLRALSAKLEAGRRVIIAREVTKRFETFAEVSSETLADWAMAHEPKGEYVVLVDEGKMRGGQLDETSLRWARAIANELPASRTAALVAKVCGLKRDEVYRALLGKEKDSEGVVDEKFVADCQGS